MEEQAKEIAELLKLLANQYRLLIICALMDGSLTVGEIHSKVPNISLSALSQHLAQLRMAGILEAEKRGLNVFYQIKDRRLLPVLEALKEQYCSES
ncbi:MAG: metalloregulator ArsR/SmtB family transcription factor [Acidaminococcus sp.]|jgi:DNA-binding transcriptional ArsR family regulator|nr:metalloregulator ArsR/SmtB family transcription factor [Acidaminococcus sp.]MCI2100376.1 metalloregulator ArsR/SmtB family transcription factor [Acidaminococcus sp.]MCI2114697.1 metalloregulator ArsR/SmtB family transcription factor [Acidaminococcus sp.]MCI2116728.1 metalloregulator ArsR/SmtB family transcription factor [Acidaminococcus sp.]